MANTVIPASAMTALLAHGNETKRLSIKNPKSAIIGSSAGYIRKEAANSPCSRSARARCKPHPGHSIPKTCLLIHGSMNFSGNNQSRCVFILGFMKAFTVKNTIIFGQ